MTKPNSLSLSLSLDQPSVLNKIKEGYLTWINIVQHMPKNSRYTIGSRIENKILDLLELARDAYFVNKENSILKIEKVSECIHILDALKFLVSVAWDAKLIGNKQFEEIAGKLNEIGRMLGGWQGKLKNPENKNRDHA